MRLSFGKRMVLFGMIFLMVFSLNQGCGKKRPTVVVPAKQSVVSVVQSTKEHATSLTYNDILEMVRNAVELAGGFEGLIHEGDTVVLKPNLVGKKDFCLPYWQGNPLAPEVNGVTTDWRVTKAVVELVREVNASGKIYIMEGSAGDTLDFMQALNYTEANFNMPNVELIAIERDSGTWQEYNSTGLVKVNLPGGRLYTSYYLNRKYKEADFVISIPTLKNHWHAVVTGGIKNVGIGATPANIYGIAANDHGRNNMVNHDTDDLHKWIHDFFMCRPVDFVIMDGLQGIENGPTPCASDGFYDPATGPMTNISQAQMNMRLILAGKDAVAVDTIESLITGWDPESVNYLKYLDESGAGETHPENIKVLGKKVDEVREYFAGRIPPAGGTKITDKTPPDMSVDSIAISGNALNLSLSVSPDTIKVEVYIDGKLCEPVITSNYSNISLDISRFPAGEYELSINAYDRFLNRAEETFLVNTQYGDYLAPKTSDIITIDGHGYEESWKRAPWHSIQSLWLGVAPSASDFSGRYKIIWSDTTDKLYYLVEITDDHLSGSAPDPLVDYYKYDTLELFIDENDKHEDHTFNYNAFAYHISTTGNIVVLDNTTPRLFNDHATVFRTQNGNIYTWEIALDIYTDAFVYGAGSNPKAALSAGKTMGFAIAYCDNDGGTDRESFIGSVGIPGADKNVAWKDTGVFGHVKLVE